MRYGCHANGFWFDFHLADFTSFFFTFFQAYVVLLRKMLGTQYGSVGTQFL